jgi:hypothetical protein
MSEISDCSIPIFLISFLFSFIEKVLCGLLLAASNQENHTKSNYAQRLFRHIHAEFLTVESRQEQAG